MSASFVATLRLGGCYAGKQRTAITPQCSVTANLKLAFNSKAEDVLAIVAAATDLAPPAPDLKSAKIPATLKRGTCTGLAEIRRQTRGSEAVRSGGGEQSTASALECALELDLGPLFQLPDQQLAAVTLCAIQIAAELASLTRVMHDLTWLPQIDTVDLIAAGVLVGAAARQLPDTAQVVDPAKPTPADGRTVRGAAAFDSILERGRHDDIVLAGARPAVGGCEITIEQCSMRIRFTATLVMDLLLEAKVRAGVRRFALLLH